MLTYNPGDWAHRSVLLDKEQSLFEQEKKKKNVTVMKMTVLH